MNAPIVNWLMTDQSLSGFGAADHADKPPLKEVYSVYLGLVAPMRQAADPIVDFVDLLRELDKTAVYSDEEWIAFFLPFTHGDEDRARDVWDGLVCQ